MKVGTAGSPTLHTLRCLARACVLSAQVHDAANSTATTSRASSLVIATDQNIIYLDTSSGIVKSCHHAVFDEAWYLQPTRPPAAQLLFDLGLEAETSFVGHDGPPHPTPIGTTKPITVPWPPSLPAHHKLSTPPPLSILAPLPLRLTAAPNVIAAAAARVRFTPDARTLTSDVVTEYLIGPHDMATIYMSPDPYGTSFRTGE